MDDRIKLLMIFCYTAPAISAVLSSVFLILGRQWQKNSPDIALRNLMLVFFITVAFNWGAISFGLFSTYHPAWLETFRFGMLLVVQVVLYHFIYALTSDRSDKRFSPWNYAFPVCMFMAMTIAALIIRPEGRVFGGHIELDAGNFSRWEHYYYKILFYTFHIRVFYGLLYTILGFRRVIRYQKIIGDYSADTGNTSLRWLMVFLLLSLPLFITSVVVAIVTPYKSLLNFWSALPAAFVFVQLPVMSYFMSSGRYVLMNIPEAEGQRVRESYRVPAGPLTQALLEEYMERAKPYLNPELKITDLSTRLKTKRSVLSTLINETYEMNFSQFVNGYRLRELEKLVEDPASAHLGTLALVRMAGFGSYHSYYRAKKQDDSRTLIQPD